MHWTIGPGAFLINFGHIYHNVFLRFFSDFGQKYHLGRLGKMKDLCDFCINSFSSTF